MSRLRAGRCVAAGLFLFFFKQKTAYDIPKRDWSSDVCSSDLRTCSKRRNSPGSRGLQYARCTRSEEHTSELQSRFGISYAVFCLQKNKRRLVVPVGHHGARGGAAPARPLAP